ncbi:MAG: D-tyrosyl-tRNA(Tyr) deacylase [Spirochaetes bacterium]|nr:D-tyrosyl-tRNA(Tyr) deacylase [Spirochaetota bacterium]
MRAVVQRVTECRVAVNKDTVGFIDKGLLVYIGVEISDNDRDVQYITDKIVNLRIFTDKNNKMNLSVKDIDAGILVISQFTLFGDVRRGRRPSYTKAADPVYAEKYYMKVLEKLNKTDLKIEAGRFREIMEVTYTNMGPVTILLDSKKLF